MRKPPNIHKKFTERIRALAAKHNMDIPEGFVLFGCNRVRGRCDDAGRVTIPLWLDDGPEGELLWYIAHEVAHAYTYIESGSWHHNATFMENMMILCPEEHWHYELGYKPRAAGAAGITLKEAK